MVVFGCFIGFCDGILPKIGVFCALFWMLYNEKMADSCGIVVVFVWFLPCFGIEFVYKI